MLIKGFVEIRVLNKDTLEVEQVITQPNTITQRLRSRIADNANSSSATYGLIGARIVVSSDTNTSTSDFWWVSSPVFGFTPSGVTSPLIHSATMVTPLYVEWNQRFDPPSPGNTRSISTVAITETTTTDVSGVAVNAYVSLITPCTQTDTQLLDVTYRMQWIRDSAITIGFTSDPATLYDHVNRLNQFSGGCTPISIWHNYNHINYTPESGTYGRLNPDGEIISGGLVFAGTSNSESVINTNGINYPLFKRLLSVSGNTSSSIGMILGSEFYLTSSKWVYGWKNITAPTGSNVQPIHSHAAATFGSSSASPFLDSSPSTGTGSLSGGGTWTNPDFPEEYMIKITTSGDVGAATYQFWKRNHFGFNGTSYVNRHIQLIPFSAYQYNTGTTPIPRPPLIGSHDVLIPYDQDNYTNSGTGIISAVYSLTKFVTANATGITIVNLANSEYVNYDSTTTPALPVTSVRQVSVDKSSGTTWIACANTGLWKLSPDGNTVTHITVAGNGVPSEMAYGVDIGRLNSIWALFDGGLASSFDDGVTWTTYNPSSVPALIQTGITDNNWSTVKYIKVDPEHADDQVALIRSPYTSVNVTMGLVWWSRGTGVSTPVTMITGNEAYSYGRLNTTNIDVSDTESFWVVAGTSAYAAAKLTFGSATITNIGSTQVYASTVAFDRGPSGEAIFINITGQGASYTVTAYNKALSVVANLATGTGSLGSMFNTITVRPLYLGRGIYVANSATTTTSSAADIGLIIGVVADGSNSLTGPFSFLVWEKYGWTGSAWVQNNAGSKTVHSTPETLLHGVTLAFTNGVSGTSFINNDYYTFGVVQGILKDNSIAYSTSVSTYFTGVKAGSTFTGVVQPHPSVGTVTWKRKSSMLTVNPNNSLVNTSPSRSFGLFAISNNRVFGDFSITGTFSPFVGTQHYMSVGLAVSKGGYGDDDEPNWVTATNAVNDYGFNLYPGSVAYCYAGTGFAGPSTTITVPGTTWEIKRVGSTLSWLIGGVVKRTLTATENSFAIRVLYGQSGSTLNSQTQETVNPITVVSSGTGYYVEVGSVGGGDGIYDPDFLSVDASSSGLALSTFSLNGIPAITKFGNSSAGPAAGEVNVLGEYSEIICNAADAGKTITGTYVYTVK